MSNRTILILAGAATVLTVGFAIGLRFNSEQPPLPVSPKEVVKVVRVPDTDLQQEYDNFKLRRQVKELQKKVAVAQAEAAPQKPTDAPLPPPVEFPRDAPPSYLPEGFRDVLRKAVKECGMGLEVATVDCSEYPCIAWTKATDANVHQFSMENCAPWRQAFPDGERIVGDSGPDDGGSTTRYFAWMPMPADNDSRAAVMKRFEKRRKYTEQELGIAP